MALAERLERMEEINVTVFSEMGRLTMEPYLPKISFELFGFILNKAIGKYTIATDKKGLGCVFPILIDGVERKESCIFEDKIVNITWDLDAFDPEHMQWLSYKDQ
jgi:hypothetical protein